MLTPQQKYNSDPKYAAFVKHLESMLHQCEFSPSEVREMAMLACVRHEMRTVRVTVTPEEINRYRRASEMASALCTVEGISDNPARVAAANKKCQRPLGCDCPECLERFGPIHPGNVGVDLGVRGGGEFRKARQG